MIPVDFEGRNSMYVLPGANNLPAYTGPMEVEGMGWVPVIQAKFRLTEAEIEQLTISRHLSVSIIGTKWPPISIQVEGM